MTTGQIHSIESFGTVDGPGIRMVVFTKGCPMRCQYCHNPDTWSLHGGTAMTVSEILDQYEASRPFYRGGGITVTGGEPLLQMEFVTELFEIAKKNGVHTTLDTSGNPFKMEPEYLEKFDRLMAVTDLFLLDIKEINDEKHKDLTGWTNKNILDLAKYLSDHDKDMWIRNVLVPGVTDAQEDLEQLRDFVASLKTVKRFEVLPYHTLGVFKWEELGIPYTLSDVMPPDKEQIARANDILRTAEYTGYLEK